MNKITRQTMVDYVLREVARGSIYVWGAQGQRGNKISEAWIKDMETSTANANRAIARWKKNKENYDPSMIGAYDCSGLIGACLNENDNKGFDDTADGYLGRCVQISKSELQPGDLVFEYSGGKSKHVGVYIGNGYVVEARGRDYGVVKTGLNDRNWKKYGRPDFMYKSSSNSSSTSGGTQVSSGTSKPSTAITDTSMELPDKILYYRLKTNMRAYFRSAPHTNNTINTILDEGSLLKYRGESGDYYYVTLEETGRKGYVHKLNTSPDYLTKSDDVKILQARLGVNADGLYGRATALAVGEVQKKAKLSVDYIYGPNTKKALEG